jgi:hypothetical protein
MAGASKLDSKEGYIDNLLRNGASQVQVAAFHGGKWFTKLYLSCPNNSEHSNLTAVLGKAFSLTSSYMSVIIDGAGMRAIIKMS